MIGMGWIDSLRKAVFVVCFVLFGYALLGTHLLLTFIVPSLDSRKWFLSSGRILCRTRQRLLKVIVGIDFRMEGEEHIPTSGAIIASNHQSQWETFIFYTLLADPVYVAKIELTRIVGFGTILKKLETIFIDRAGGTSALRRLGHEVGTALAAGRQVIIFPEGTRAKPGSEIKLKSGIDFLHRVTGAPIIPVTHDSGRIWDNARLAKRDRCITLKFHSPITNGDIAISKQLAAIYESECTNHGHTPITEGQNA